MTASNINQQGIVFAPYIIATTTATISASGEFYNRMKRKERHNRLNVLLDEHDEIVEENCISSRYGLVRISGTHSAYYTI